MQIDNLGSSQKTTNTQHKHNIDQLLSSLATKIELSSSSQLINSSINQQVAETRKNASTQIQSLEKKLAEQTMQADSMSTDIVLIKKQI